MEALPGQFRVAPVGTPLSQPVTGATVDERPAMLLQALSVLWRRKLLIAAVTLGCVALGLLLTMLMTPQYTATATVEIQRDTGGLIDIQGTQKAPVVDTEFYETQYGLMKSETLANRVATSLRLMDNPAFFQEFGNSKAATWFRNGRPLATAPSRDDRIRAAGKILLGRIKVDPKRLSRLVQVSFTGPDAAQAQRVANSWAQTFIQLTLERRFDAASYARNFLEQRLRQLRARIDDSERQLVGYASREGIVNVPGTVSTGGNGDAAAVTTSERPLIADDLAILNRELAQATADRVVAQSRMSAPGSEVNEALTNPAISGLRERRAELASEYARLMVQFEPSYPPARALHDQIAQIDRALGAEEGRVSGTLDQTFRAAQAREQSLQQKVNSLKTGVLDLRRRSIEYNIIQRDVDTNRQLYDALLQKYKEIGVAGGVGVNNISIVDGAELPLSPSSPKLIINLLLALLAGLAIGSGAALLLDQLDQGVADPRELEEALGVPLLGLIPRVIGGDPIEALSDRKSVTSEAYTSLLTTLGFATDHGVPRSMATTSTRASEGKSTTAYALSIALARSKRRVVLVDADMRSPSVHSELGIRNQVGLSNYLAGAADLSAVLHATGQEDLSVITAGPQPPSAPELLSSDRFNTLMAELTARFDHVIFDIPPVMHLADAPIVASRMEGVLMIVESHSTYKSAARTSLNRLIAANAPVLGVVLTKFDSKRSTYGYGYEYGYSYGSNDA